MTQDTLWDSIVIGTSPLMLMHAQYLCLQGETVLILDRESAAGGAWQGVEIETGATIEIGCHVIEAFPKVYECLEHYSAVPFERLDQQPIRITRSGKIVAYFNRTMLFAAAIRMSLASIWFKGRTLNASTSDAMNGYLNNVVKLRNLLRFQLGFLWGCPEMEGPRTGYIDFLNRLCQRAQHAGAQIERQEVRAVKALDISTPSATQWQVTLADGSTRVAKRIHCTTSATLRSTVEDYTEWHAVNAIHDHRRALVVDIADQDVDQWQTYVGFWRRPVVRRISRINQPQTMAGAPEPGFSRFLVEFHETETADDANRAFQASISALQDARILKANLDATTHVHPVGVVNCIAARNVDVLPEGTLAPGFETYHSAGNLAAGIANWIRRHKIDVSKSSA